MSPNESRSARQQPGPELDANRPLSSEERQEFDRCCQLIKTGPRTVEAIGEPISTVNRRRLYRQVVANMDTFFPICVAMESEEGFKLLAGWEKVHAGIADAHPPVLNQEATIAGSTPAPATQIGEPARSQNRHKDCEISPITSPASRPEAVKPNTKPEPNSAKVTKSTSVAVVSQPVVSGPEGNQSRPVPAVCETVIPLSEIKVDVSLQCRDSINRRTVSEYAQRMKAGDTFPPLDLFDIEGKKRPVDGFHRIEAAKEAKLKSISVRIHQGTRKDAVRFAIEANRAHGLQFTNKDKRRAVELALQELPDQSDGVIAEMVGVSQPFVSKLSRQLKTVMGSGGGPKTGRDGKKRSATSRKQNAKAKPTSQSATATNDERDHTATTDKGSAQKKAGKDAEAGRKSAKEDAKSQFDLRTSLRRIKESVLTESKQCPEHLRVQFWGELAKFTKDHSQPKRS